MLVGGHVAALSAALELSGGPQALHNGFKPLQLRQEVVFFTKQQGTGLSRSERLLCPLLLLVLLLLLASFSLLGQTAGDSEM